jgi:hypothetical protein
MMACRCSTPAGKCTVAALPDRSVCLTNDTPAVAGNGVVRVTTLANRQQWRPTSSFVRKTQRTPELLKGLETACLLRCLAWALVPRRQRIRHGHDIAIAAHYQRRISNGLCVVKLQDVQHGHK